MYRIILLLTICCIIACSQEENRFPQITEDFCSQIEKKDFPVLSFYMDSLQGLTASKTGVVSLEEGDLSMLFRAWLSSAAEKSIDVQYFIFSADNIGLIAVDYLLLAADKGVKVRLMVDDILVEADADELLALDSHENISIKIYNPTTNLGKNLPEKLYSLTSDFRGFNQRMHNKTFIVDNRVVVTGGRNMADEYFDYDHEYNFRDRDVLLMGKAVQDVSNSFEQYWENELSISISDLVSVDDSKINAAVKFEYLHQYACNPSNFWPEVRDQIDNLPSYFQGMLDSGDIVWTDELSFVADRPGKNAGDEGLSGGGLTTDSLINLIAKAEKSVYIQTPYLVTTELSQNLFRNVIARGVEVKVLTNSLMSTDNLEAFSGYKRERQTLIDIGLDIYEFRPDAAIRYEVMTGALQKKLDFTPKFGLHAKSMVVDGQVAVVGTFNFDPRSANLNTECITIIHDETIASRLEQVMVEEFKPENAWHTTDEYNPDDEAGNMKQFQLWLRGMVPKSIL